MIEELVPERGDYSILEESSDSAIRNPERGDSSIQGGGVPESVIRNLERGMLRFTKESL